MSKIEDLIEQMTPGQRSIYDNAIARQSYLSDYRRLDAARHILAGWVDFWEIDNLNLARARMKYKSRMLYKAGVPQRECWCRPSSGGKWGKSVEYRYVPALPTTEQEKTILDLYRQASDGSGIDVSWDDAAKQVRVGKYLLRNEIDPSLTFHCKNLTSIYAG